MPDPGLCVPHQQTPSENAAAEAGHPRNQCDNRDPMPVLADRSPRENSKDFRGVQTESSFWPGNRGG
jgi:hypothetical protein